MVWFPRCGAEGKCRPAFPCVCPAPDSRRSRSAPPQDGEVAASLRVLSVLRGSPHPSAAVLARRAATIARHLLTAEAHAATVEPHASAFAGHPATVQAHPATVAACASAFQACGSTFKGCGSTIGGHPSAFKMCGSTPEGCGSTFAAHPPMAEIYHFEGTRSADMCSLIASSTVEHRGLGTALWSQVI